VLGTEWNVAQNLARLQESIAEAALRAGRKADEITLVGVSKTQPAEAVVEAVRAGVVHFGENRVQEAAAKVPQVRQLLQADPVLGRQSGALEASAVLHMIGHLQSNKVGVAVGVFDSVDSVDSLHLAQALSRRVQAEGRAELPIRLEVYVGDDERRPGLRPDALAETTGQIVELPGLRVEGLMTVAPLGGDAQSAFARVRALQNELAEMFPRVHFGVLSMGMSEDYVLAIQEGSTEIRIGTALFGPRRNMTS
jgi:pyridoxal phosphate enzyme (YggS family)